MSEIRKNKISLDDYDYKSDINNRLLMSQISTLDLLVLEEILYSPLKLSLKKLSNSLDVEEEKIIPILNKFSKTGLLTVQNDEIIVDKDKRKYFESQIVKFDGEFTPGMEFLQGLLKKVPIQILPTWYSIPRASNNIFDSLVEKYLLTPQIFQRYLLEVQLCDPVLTEMSKIVYSSPHFKVLGSELIERLELSREQFEENMLFLEFNFICCLGYEKIGDDWKEIVTPFQEWREYLSFLKNTEPVPISQNADIIRSLSSDFAFIQDLSSVLSLIKNEKISLYHESNRLDENSRLKLLAEGKDLSEEKFFSCLEKLRLLKFVEIQNHQFHILEGANEWLEMSIENRALFIYRYPLNRLSIKNESFSYLCSEKSVREAEKSILRILNKGWVYFDDFIKGVTIPLNEQSVVTLKKLGKNWKYVLPEYSEEEKKIIKATIFNWLSEVGIVATGTYNGRDCFCVTSFGQSIFGAR